MEFLQNTRQLCRVRSRVVWSPGHLGLVKNVQARPNFGFSSCGSYVACPPPIPQCALLTCMWYKHWGRSGWKGVMTKDRAVPKRVVFGRALADA